LTNQIRRHAPGLGLIILAGFLLRLVWVIYVHPDPPADHRFDDTAWYRGAAHFISIGAGYVNPYVGTPTAGWPPGYPYFLGGVYKAFGEGTTSTYAANIVLSLLTVIVVYGIGLRLFDRRTALIAAAAIAVWPGQIYFTSLTLSEPLFTLLFTFAVLLMLLVTDALAWRRPLLIALGVVTGLAALTRGQALLLLPVALIAWAAAGYRWLPATRWTLAAAAVVAVVMAPWVIRNQRELGSPVLIATNFGPNLWLGNHDTATGRMSVPEPEPPQPTRGNRTQSELEVAADTLALRKGLAFMFTHPGDEVGLSMTKIRAMYESDATALDWNAGYRSDYYASQRTEENLRSLANGFWFAMIALAGVGLVSLRSRLTALPGALPLILLLWTAMHLLFFGDARFHYPVVFTIALLGARGLVAVFDALPRPWTVPEPEYAAT
jgi:4-amino-4-deoxy-L-arabinose transferase-like glycosyltransferase